MYTKDHVSTHKCVSGELVELTDAERQAIADEWNAAVPTHGDLVAGTLARARALRLPIIQVLDGMQASAIVTDTFILVDQEPVALKSVIEDCKQALRDLPGTVDLSQCTTQQQMELAVLQAYQAIVLAAPPEIKSAFDSLKP